MDNSATPLLLSLLLSRIALLLPNSECAVPGTTDDRLLYDDNEDDVDDVNSGDDDANWEEEESR